MSTKHLTIGEAAKALGVSADTLRRWDREGKLNAKRDSRGRRMISQAEIKRLSTRPQRPGTGDDFSARNRFEGEVVSVEIDGVMALIELQAGPFRVVSVITRDAAEELALAPGMTATATVKATSVMVQRS